MDTEYSTTRYTHYYSVIIHPFRSDRNKMLLSYAYHAAASECRDLATRSVPSVAPTVVTTTTTNPFPSGMIYI